MSRRFEWTEEKLRYLEEHFATDTANDIAEVVGCSDSTVLNKARKLGLEKSPDFHPSHFYGRYVQKGGIIKKR